MRLMEQILWENRKFYIVLFEQYLRSKIDAEEAVDNFFALYYNHQNAIREIRLDPERVAKVQIDSKSEGFLDVMHKIFYTCEPFDIEETDDNSGYPISENTLRKEIILRLQELKNYDSI